MYNGNEISLVDLPSNKVSELYIGDEIRLVDWSSNKLVICIVVMKSVYWIIQVTM